MVILDTSEIQARKANPQAREISRLTWTSASIPQNAIPFTEHGHPYVLEFDEYTQGTINPAGSRDVVGAGRIIDIADETHPFVVANLRLQVDQPPDHAAAGSDPGTFSAAQGYAAHYCNIPTRVDPRIVACSFIASGLRVFDISDIDHPREVAYFVAPTTPNTETGYTESDYAMSQPAFDIARHEIWYTDGGTGFYVLRVDNGIWPGSSATSAPSTRLRCPPATGRLARRSLGPVSLGVRRARVRARGRCLGAFGIRVAYPSRATLRTLAPKARHRFAGRVAVILTSNPHYALRGVRPFARLATARRRFRIGRGMRIGVHTWYLVAAGASRGVLEVRRGVVVAVGIAEKALTARRGTTRKLLGRVT
jgi:hypothetical protein